MFGKLAIAALIASTPVVAGEEGTIVDACVKEFDPSTDYFPFKYVKPLISSYGELDIFGEKFVPHNVSN